MKNLRINPEIEERLEDFEIPVKDGVNYLLGVYFDSIASTFPVKLKKQVGITKIFTGSQKNLEWKIPLFISEEDEDRNWILDEYRQMFKDIRKDRAGPKKSVEKRMLLFMSNNPTVTGEDILLATKNYLQSLSDSKYLTSAHYFISKGSGTNKVSLLEQWLEETIEEESYYDEDNKTEEIQ